MLALVAVVFSGVAAAQLAALPPAAGEPVIRVLFLGDQGHHHPVDLASTLKAVMAGRGIEITYTERLADLNPATLARHDALLIYANIDQLGDAEEKSLLDYVESGHGLVALHCASYCFHNSPAYIALVGGEFERHGTGEFDTQASQAEHPIMRGFAPFHTWDETYVHRRHNTENREVLQTRREGAGDEPWTWTRRQGQGRVFYTAYGHDARTWNQPGFQALVERGIRWASGREVFDSRMRPNAGLAPFTYSPAKVPLYLPNQARGGHAEPKSQMQNPLDPAESMKHLVTPRGFEARLFASEPDIGKPITMAWDERGRLWVAETADYPNELQEPGQGHDRIRILEDTDGDGRADKFTLFADKLSIPTSVLPVRGGVIVHQAPVTLFLKDTDGDDHEDSRETLLSGWGSHDTHSGPSNLHWGFDNWIWGIVGYSGFKGTVGGEALDFKQGFFRFRPDGSKLEYLRGASNNSWGMSFDETGLVFGSTANGNPSVFMPIPNRYYENVRGGSAAVLPMAAVDNHIEPITENVRQVDWHGGFTAAAGHAIYTARLWPETYWNRTAFVCEPTGHLVATFFLEPRGSDFVTRNSWNQLASDDEWTAPILAEVGPDGNVWVIDWYNYIVQHNPTPHGFENGKGNAYLTPLRDKQHGRIYRIVARGREPAPAPRLDAASPDTLLAALESDNLFWRMHAQRMLVERGNRDVANKLIALTGLETCDALGECPAALHALHALEGLGLLGGSERAEDRDDPSRQAATNAAIAALKYPAAGVRRAATQTLPRGPRCAEALLAANIPLDADAQARLAGFLALAEMPPSDRAARAILEAMADPRNALDRWIPDAALAAAAVNSHAALIALAQGEPKSGVKFPGDEKSLAWVSRLAEHEARGKAVDTIGEIVAAFDSAPNGSKADPLRAEAIVRGLARGWPKDTPAKLDAQADAALVALFERLSLASKSELATLADRLGSKAFEGRMAQLRAGLLSAAEDTTKSDDERTKAARQAVESDSSGAEPCRQLLALLTPRLSPGLADAFLEAIGRSRSSAVGAALVEQLPGSTPDVRRKIVGLLLARAEWTPDLIAALEGHAMAVNELSLDEKQALLAHPNRKLAERSKKLLASDGGLPNADRQKVIDQLGPKALAGGDSARGKAVFVKECSKCHMHGAEGKRIGPDLTGMAAHPKQELLIHILDPSRSVEGNFRQYSVVTDDGRVLSGLLGAQSKTAIQLIDAEGKTHEILRENIEVLKASPKSMMPEGFEKQLSPEALGDLLSFLTERGRFLPLDLRNVATISSSQGMFYSAGSMAERMMLTDWSPRVVESAPFQLIDPKSGETPNVILLYGPAGEFPPRMPKSVRVAASGPAKAIHLLSGVSGWGYHGGPARPSVSLIVRLNYQDGEVEEHPLENGVHFADYIRRVDVPESKWAFAFEGGQQIRYLAIRPRRTAPLRDIEFVKGVDATSPVIMAITIETDKPSRDARSQSIVRKRSSWRPSPSDFGRSTARRPR